MLRSQVIRLLHMSVYLCLAGMVPGLHGETKRALLIGINHYAPPPGAVPAVPPGAHALDSRFAPGTSWQNLEGPSVDVASMQLLLQDTFKFTDIRVLPEEKATRVGILAALDQLVADARPGDLIVFYYAGHGSQRLDTLSSKDHLDETIVPIDAWKGAKDIRDKELAARFNSILDKKARLTAIYDSCHSGTMARGITDSVQRTLPYDDRDVAAEKKQDAATITEADLKTLPQKGNAIILVAADSTQSAVEARYPDDHQFHGAFTRALVRVLRSSSQTLSAEDVVASVSSMIHADAVPFQQPSVEGQIHESLFGAPVAAHSLHVHVTKVEGTKITLDVGSAGGFDVGTQFTAFEPNDGTVMEIKSVPEPLVSIAEVSSGPPDVKPGQIFELTTMTYPQAARLVIFAPKTVPDSAEMPKVKAMFPSLTWVDDPTLKPIDFLVVASGRGWVAYNQNGQQSGPGTAPRGVGFLLLGPPASLIDRIEQGPPFERNALRFTDKLTEANYLLAMRTNLAGKPEYALFDRMSVLGAHKADAYVTSAENDPDDAALNGGVAPQVVCRNDVSLPVRTAWLPDDLNSGGQIVVALNRRIVRLGKLRVWLQSPALAPGAGGWPYRLAITQPNSESEIAGATLHPNQQYEVKLVATDISSVTPIPKYIYLFGFDCAANPFLLYPMAETNGDAKFPQPNQDGVFPKSIKLLDESVGAPVGADTLIFMATKEKITNLSLLTADGILEDKSRGAGGFDQLVNDMSDANSRGPESVPTNWLVQQLVIPSRP